MSKPIQPTDSDPKPTPREYAELLWLKDLFSFRNGVSQKPDSGESERPEAADDSAPLEDSETRDSDKPEPSSGAGETPSQLSDPSQSPSSAEKVTGERTHLFFGEQSPLADPLSHQRALHRLIPPREKSWDRQIDLAETVRQTAAAGGRLRLNFRYPKERRGHLVILVSDGVALAPWYPVIEQYRRLAQTCGAFRSISRDVIRIPAHADRDFPDTPTGIRPGKDNLLLLIHDGLGDGMIRGTIGRYLQRQVQGLGEQAKIAWLHPWQESTWPRTSVSRLPVRSIESADGDSLVVPIIPIEKGRQREAGLKALEGWFTGQRISGIRARQLPVMESPEPEKTQPDRRQVTERSVEEWCTRFDRLVDASGLLTGRLLCLAASFSGRTSVQILSVVAEEVLSVDEDIREPIARAITSGFLRRARVEKTTESTPDDTEEVTEKVALEFHPNAREAVLKRMDAEDIRAIHEACEEMVQSDHKQISWKKYWQVDLEKPDETGAGSELISKSESYAIRKYGGMKSEESIIKGVTDSVAETPNSGERPDSIAGLTLGEIATLEEGGDRALQIFWDHYSTLEANVIQQYKSKGRIGIFRRGGSRPSDPEAYFDAGDGPTSTELEQLVSQVMDRLRVKAVEGDLVNLLLPGKSSDPIGVIWNPFLLHLLKDHMDSVRLRNNMDSETPPLHRQSFSQSAADDKTDENLEESKTESGGWWQNFKDAASGIVDKITRTGLENLEVEILEKLQKEMETGDRNPEVILELKEKFEKVHRLDPQAILSTSEQLSDLGLIEEQGRLLDLATSEGCDEAKVEHARWIMLRAKNREDQIRSEKMLQELVVKDEENTSRKALEILSTLVPSSRSANESWAVTRESRLRFWDAVESEGLADDFTFNPHKMISAEGLYQQASIYPIPEGEIVLQWVPGEVKLILQNRDQTKMKQFSSTMKSSGQLETGLESGLVLEPKPSPDWNEFQYSVKLHRHDRREAQNVAGVMSHQFRSMIDKWDELQKTAGSLLPLDAIVDKIIALGIPGLVLLVVMATSGYAGAAAITFSLAALGGPAGMVGGVAVLGLLGLLSKAGAEYGFENIYRLYLSRQLENGRTVADLKNEIHQSYLTKSLKTKVISFIEEMEQEKTDSMSEDSPSSVKQEEEEIPMSPEVAIHPFWSEFFRRGVPLHPELADKTPTGNNMRKIGPGIGNRIQIDVNWTPNVVSLRPLSSKPENLRPLLEDRDAFEKEVGVPEKWNVGTDAFLGITLLPAPKEVQAGWSTEQQVTAALELYGRIKDYLQKQM